MSPRKKAKPSKGEKKSPFAHIDKNVIAIVQAGVELKDLRLLRGTFRSPLENTEISALHQNINIRLQIVKERSELRFVISCTLSSSEDEKPNEAEAIFLIHAAFFASYEVKEMASVTEPVAHSFGQQLALTHVWPYWREFTQSTMLRMGLPPLRLPLFKVGDFKFQADKVNSTKPSKRKKRSQKSK